MSYQLLPPLTEEEYQSLKADIAERGIIVPIELDEAGSILDGHHRLKVWQELKDNGVELPDYPRVVRAGMTEQQKRNHVRALNIIRRQLTGAQRQEQMEAMRADGMTYEAIAEAVGVSTKTVQRSVLSNDKTQPDFVTGKDGKKYPPKKKRKKKKEQPKPPQAPAASVFTGSDVGEEKAKAQAQKIADNGSSGASRQVQTTIFSHESNEWNTPQHIIDKVLLVLGQIDLDPCSNSVNTPNIPAKKHFTIADNGLSHPWMGCIYMNPPYGREIKDWVEYLCCEYEGGNVKEALALVPSRTDTEWFRRMRAYPRCFIWGRLNFSDSENSAPFPSMMVYFGKNFPQFLNVFSEIGDIYILHEE